jgi:Holliday junction resolvase-like predicted endonuclease
VAELASLYDAWAGRSGVKPGRGFRSAGVRRGEERRGGTHGAAIEAVTPEKKRRIGRAARLNAARNRRSESPTRFDVIAIDWGSDGPKLRHERGAFAAE